MLKDYTSVSHNDNFLLSSVPYPDTFYLDGTCEKYALDTCFSDLSLNPKKTAFPIASTNLTIPR